jgi:hypothetical protein
MTATATAIPAAAASCGALCALFIPAMATPPPTNAPAKAISQKSVTRGLFPEVPAFLDPPSVGVISAVGVEVVRSESVSLGSKLQRGHVSSSVPNWAPHLGQ